MNTTTDTTSYAERFIAALRRIEDDRGKMAALRRGLSDGTQRTAWPVIASLGMDIGNQAAITVAGLFATHPVISNARSLGQTCRFIAVDSGLASDIPESFDKRFRRLIACDTVEEVTGQLSAWIRLAKSRPNRVGVNYEQLFWDLSGWDKRSSAIKVQWARDFWSSRKDEEATSTPEVTAP
ncbi:MAG: type I-E CRISPR-associated protein Cse2/CasB [Verrucomicrobiaceae bacterium]|nr:type I-E CRISPR-associated protein Cse2/CasB [Verrucomicrobiaceae bacterium]